MPTKILDIFVPTKDRPEFLRESLQSIRQQTMQSFNLYVLDNASKKNKTNKAISRIFGAEYTLNKTDLGIIGNWNKALKLSKAKYLNIFHDDDQMLPEFIATSIRYLESHPRTAFSFSGASKVDSKLKYVSPWANFQFPAGRIKGEKYIYQTLRMGCCLTIAPTVVLRNSVVKSIGNFTDDICFNSFDFNFFLRAAMKFDVVSIPEILVNYRLHSGQMSQIYWWNQKKAKGRLATMYELQNINSWLLDKAIKRKNTKLRNFCIKNISKFNKESAEHSRILIPEL